jgi:simple sugar transport system permease protein
VTAELTVATPLPRTAVRRDLVLTVVLYTTSIAAALLVSSLLVAATGGSASAVWTALLDGSVRSAGAWGLTLTTMTPLLLVATGMIVATRAGMVNIGQEGQLLVGAAFAAYLAVRLSGPAPLIILCSLLFSAVGGGVWSGIAAGMRTWRQVPEVLTTLLLTFIAYPLVTYGLRQSWLLADRDNVGTNQVNSGEQLDPTTLLPNIRVFGNSIDSGVLIAIAVAAAAAVVMSSTRLGMRIDVLGQNPRAARRFGVRHRTLSASTLIFSGAMAGVAGGVLLHGDVAGNRLTFNIANNFGWDGLLVALLARNRLVAVIPIAFVFAALRTGSSFLATTGVDRKMTDVVQALLVLALLIPPAVLFVRDWRRTTRSASSGTV